MAEERRQNDNYSDEAARKKALGDGVYVLIILSVLTLGEFLVGVIAPAWGLVLLIAAIFKAVFVVKDYMHISRLWVKEDEH